MIMFPWIPRRYPLTDRPIRIFFTKYFFIIYIYIDVLNIICEKNNYPRDCLDF